jgi:hypothetical protein
LIATGRYHELRYEDLERDPIGQMRKLYAAISFPPFEHIEPDLRRYVDSLNSYKKNVHVELSPDLRERIAADWRRCFEEWGYSMEDSVGKPVSAR